MKKSQYPERTSVSLTEEQYSWLLETSEQEEKSIGEIIRYALDVFIISNKTNKERNFQNENE